MHLRIWFTIIVGILLLYFNDGGDLIAQEIRLVDFKHLQNNTTARINKKKDVNGQDCAILIIKHNLSNFDIESAIGIESREDKTGETWIWLSPDEYKITIRKQGYIPLEYDLRNRLKGLETYELVLQDEYGRLIVEAPGAAIYLNDRIAGNDTHDIRLKEGEVRVSAKRECYYEQSQLVLISAGEESSVSFMLNPIMGNLIVTSDPAEASIYINNGLNQQISPANIPLMIGEYDLRVEKEGFLTESQSITINENLNTSVNFTFRINPDEALTKQKRNRNIFLYSTIGFTAAGTISRLYSNKLYAEYESAGSGAEDIRKRIEVLDIVTPVTYSLAGVFGVGFIWQASKYSKLKREYSLSAIPGNRGAYIHFACSF